MVCHFFHAIHQAPVALLLFALGAKIQASTCPSIHVEKELLIRDLSVVNSSLAEGGGPWSFDSLIAKLGGHRQKAPFMIHTWLNHWEAPQSVNNHDVEPRPGRDLFDLWPQTADGMPKYGHAPMRLLAIVLRLDQVSARAPFGEGRFVFSAFRPADNAALPFTAIFEFPLPSYDQEPPQETRHAWAKAFHQLAQMPFGLAFNQRLLALTQRFTAPSSLLAHMRLRTNDFFLGFEWELREYKLDADRLLKLTTTAFTPAASFDRTRFAELEHWARQHESALQSNTFELPAAWLGGAAHAPREGFKWLDGIGLSAAARHNFSISTCNGCHTGDTRTRFTHIEPRPRNMPAKLSAYLERELQTRAQQTQNELCFPHAVPPQRMLLPKRGH